MTSDTITSGWRQAMRGVWRTPSASEMFAADQLDRHARALQSAVALAMAIVIAFSTSLFLDGDTGWHLGAGDWIIANGRVPMVDPFSHSMPGTAWTAHEWLAELVMVGARGAGGWAGLTLPFAAAMALTAWLLLREANRFLPARWAIGIVILAMGLLLQFSLARPHMLAWPLLAGWTIILLRARERNEAPPLAAAALLIVWANLHASYIMAFGLAGLFGLESLIANRRNLPLLGRWCLFGAAMLAGALITPFGPSHFLYPFEVSGMAALSIISEWRRSVPATDGLFYFCLAALALLIALRWRRIPPLRLLLLVGLATMAIMHARHQMLFAIIGMLVILPLIQPDHAPRERLAATRWLVPGLATLAVIRLLVPLQPADTGSYPLALLARVPESIKRQPVINEYSQGGPLVMLGYRPYIDGRADMYGDAFTFRAKAIAKGDIVAFRQDAARYKIGWVLLASGNGLVRKLDREPGWRRLVADQHAVVFVPAR